MSISGGLWAHALLKLNGQYAALDLAFAELLKRDASALRKSSFQQLTYYEDLPASLDAAEKVARTGERCSLRKRYVRGDGSLLWVLVEVSLLHASAGERLMLSGYAPSPNPAAG